MQTKSCVAFGYSEFSLYGWCFTINLQLHKKCHLTHVLSTGIVNKIGFHSFDGFISDSHVDETIAVKKNKNR